MHRVLVIALLCGCAGTYQGSTKLVPGPDPGETNGRMFDFISDKPDGDDWQIRVRGTSIWVSHSQETKSDQFGGAQNLTEAEGIKLWNMIDALDIMDRKHGKQDQDNGTVTLRLREPSDEGPHDVHTVYVSRDTEDDDVLALGKYLRQLVTTHFKTNAAF